MNLFIQQENEGAARHRQTINSEKRKIKNITAKTETDQKLSVV